MLIMLFISPFKGAVSQCQEYAVAAREIFAIFLENNVVLKTSQLSLIEMAWAFSQPVAALTVTYPRA